MIKIPRDTYERSEDPRTLIPAGRHLVEVTRVEEDAGEEWVALHYVVKGGEANGLKGEERFYLSPNAIKRYAILLKRLGVVERGESAESSCLFDPQDVVGAEIVAEVIHEEKTRKNGDTYLISKWTWDQFWSASDPRAGGQAPTPRQTQARQSRPTALAAASADEI